MAIHISTSPPHQFFNWSLTPMRKSSMFIYHIEVANFSDNGQHPNNDRSGTPCGKSNHWKVMRWRNEWHILITAWKRAWNNIWTANAQSFVVWKDERMRRRNCLAIIFLCGTFCDVDQWNFQLSRILICVFRRSFQRFIEYDLLLASQLWMRFDSIEVGHWNCWVV